MEPSREAERPTPVRNSYLQQVQALSSKQESIRNICLLGKQSHGKSTLILSMARETEALPTGIQVCKQSPTHQKEVQLKAAVRSTGKTIVYRNKEEEHQGFLINIIECSSNRNWVSETSLSLIASDGAILVFDVGSSIDICTQRLIRETIVQRIPLLLVLNKLDKGINNPDFNGEELYLQLLGIIDELNLIISLACNTANALDPSNLNVVFASAEEGWAFTIGSFAKIYAQMFAGADDLNTKLWGNSYFEEKTGQWAAYNQEESKVLERGFVKFILNPLHKLREAIGNFQLQQATFLLGSLGIETDIRSTHLAGKELFQHIMVSRFSCADVILPIIIHHLPSPQESQRHRVPLIYGGSSSDPCTIGIMNCDVQAPLVILVYRFVRTNGRFYALGRVFSGTASEGSRVRIMGPDYRSTSKADLFQTTLKQLRIGIYPHSIDSLQSIPCGNIIGISGLERFMSKFGTISDNSHCLPIRTVKHLTPPVVRVSVTTKQVEDLPKLVEGLKQLSRVDHNVTHTIQETGENTISSCSHSHLEMSVQTLQRDYVRCQLIKPQFSVIFRETVTTDTREICLAKTANRHSRLYGYSEPMFEPLSLAIESGAVLADEQVKARAKRLCEDFGWEKSDALRVWSFGPSNSGPNCLVDTTKAVHYLGEIKDSLVWAWQLVTKSGVLAEEQLRGVRVNITDVLMMSDSIHRGSGQMTPAARRLYYACQLSSVPSLLEPFYRYEIKVPTQYERQISEELQQRRGEIIQLQTTKNDSRALAPMLRFRAFLPTQQVAGLEKVISQLTKGKGTVDYWFDHWELLEDLPYDKGSKAEQLIFNIRRRKGMKVELPCINDFKDRL